MRKTKISPRISSKRLRLVVIAASLATVGAVLLISAGAATSTVRIEAEDGAVSGHATADSLNGTSGGRGVRFGSSQTAAGPTAFSTLQSDPDKTQEASDAGLKVAMVEFWWTEYEPQDGQFNAQYAAGVKHEIDMHIAAGRRVTLGIGTHATPSWMSSVPNSRYVNEQGEQGPADEFNFVFNQKTRDKLERYFARLDADLNLDRIWAIRLTSGGNAEMMYPEGGFWAYDVNAQNGPDMPPTMARNPFPGWKPGNASLTTAQVRQWTEWYIGALGNVTDFQMKSLRAKGFKGYFETVTPGAGVRPSRYDETVNNRLADEDLLGRGVAWHRYYALIPDKTNVVAYSSSVAEGEFGPGNGDSCQAGDRTTPIGSAMDEWSTARFISRIGDEYGMKKGGENPGQGMPAIPSYSDTSPNGMMASAMRYASTCKFHVFYWAHDHNLYNGDVKFSDYVNGIKSVTGGNNPLPPMP